MRASFTLASSLALALGVSVFASAYTASATHVKGLSHSKQSLTIAPNMKTGAALAIPDGFFWDSLEQQCEIGGKKIVYRFKRVPSGTLGYDWEVLYEAKTEFKSTNGWAADNNLHSVYSFFTYADGSQPNAERSIYLNNSPKSTGSLLKGTGYPLFGTMVMTVKAGGFSKGFQVTWPNGNGCQFS